MKFVRDLSKAEKLDIYKKVKGSCLFEGCWNLNCMKNVLDEKVKDVLDILDYDMVIDSMAVYRDYTYGR